MKPAATLTIRTCISLVSAAVLILTSFSLSSTMVEVALRDSHDLRLLQNQGFDIVHVSRGRMVDVIIRHDSELDRLIGTGLHYNVAIPDIEEFIEQRFAPRRDDMNGYPTYSEIVDAMFEMADNYAEIVAEPVSIGESIEGRDIWAFKISDNPDDDEDEPEILITSLIHAREVITPEVTLAVMHLLTEEYGQDDYITNLVNDREIWFIPCHNPDGYVYNEEDNGELMWRKNRRRNNDGTIGVDLNRNFGYEWGYDNRGSSPDGEEETYRGTRPFSEPETQCAREFINDHEFIISLYFHSWGNYCLIPLGYDYIHAADRTLFRALGTRLTEVSNYFAGTCWECLYPTNGDSDDWLYMSDEHQPILAMTIEVGNRNDYFWPPRNRVEPLVNENIPTCLAAIDYADSPLRALPPMSPGDVTVYSGRDDRLHLNWEPGQDGFNPPVSYNVMSRQMGDPIVEEFDAENELWVADLFSSSRVSPHSAPYCIRAEYREEKATLTLREPIIPPDTLYSWLRFNLSWSNNMALEVSTNGFNWQSVPGSITEDIIEAGYNHGPGIRDRDEEDWIRASWYLSEWSEQLVSLRFRYYSFDDYGNRDFFYIDDIEPIPSVEWSEIIAEEVEAEFWVSDGDLEEDVEYLVQAADAEGHQSYWSMPAVVVDAPPAYTIMAGEGWTMISLPVELNQPALEDLLHPWIERDVLTLIKDGFGNFFIPRYNFNLIGNWKPLYGYYVHLESEDELAVIGNRIPADTPIPLELGWNMIAYLPSEQMCSEDALASIVDNLVLVKDDHGHFWAVENGYNDLPDLESGRGYIVKIDRPDTLVYPAEPGFFSEEYTDLRGISSQRPISPYNHSVIMQIDESINEGEIVLRDGRGELAGLAQVSGGAVTVGIAAWGQFDENSAGYAAGETLQAYWRYSENHKETPLKLTLIEGDLNYTTDGFSVFCVRCDLETFIPSSAHLLDAFPNPFNDRVKVTYRLEEPSRIRLSITDCTGREIVELYSGVQGVGIHETTWNSVNKASGLYIGRLEVQNNNRNTVLRTKMILVR